MTKEEVKVELEWIISLSQLKQEDKKRMLTIHRELFGQSMDYCDTCPEQVRMGFNRLKLYYERNIN